MKEPAGARGARASCFSGQPLDTATRAALEPRFGYDLSRVRIHRDGQAADLAERVGAAAFTIGRHVHFGAGQYAPQTAAGRRLLAHELAHVVQQASGVAGRDSRALEHDAERRAEQALVQKQPGCFEREETPPRIPGRLHMSHLRELPAPPHPLIQCYRVPGRLRCDEVVDWLNANSPYAPEWAETRCTYSFEGGVQTRSRTLGDGRVQVTARGTRDATVAVDCPIDRPEWEPGERTNRDAEVAAWNAMRRTLDAHEQQHRRIGQRWRATLERRFQAVSFTVTGSDEANAIQQAQDRVATDQRQWQADAQAAQDAIDPFRGAVLECP